MFRNLILSSLCLIVSVATSFADPSKAPKRSSATRKPSSTQSVTTRQERMDRVVDEAAVSSRETAIVNIKRILRMKRGTKEEPGLLWRLAEMEWRSSKNHFRVGVSHGGKQGSNKRYDELLHAVVDHTSEILQRFPKFKEIRNVLLLRGKSYAELNQKNLALKDYLTYIDRYAEEPQTVSVRLMAADVMAEFSQHKEILAILRPVDLTKSHDGLVGHVVERQALAYFYTEAYAEALKKAEWMLRYDRSKNLHLEKVSHYDEVIAMVALFYGSAFEKRLAGYSLEHALEYFSKLEKGQIQSKVSHEFVIVMRSKEMQAEVIDWKDLHLKRIPENYATLMALVDAYDAIINWKMYPKFGTIEKDFDKFFDQNPAYIARAQNEEYFKKFKKNLLEFADKIYSTLPKKDASVADHQVIAEPYLTALNAYSRIADAKDEVKAKVRFRVGEFYVGMRDWDKAQRAFTEVYQAKNFVVTEPGLRDQARIRAMTARYDYFKDQGIIPKSLKALPLSASANKKPLPQDVYEWIKWVDEVAGLATTSAGGPAVQAKNDPKASTASVESNPKETMDKLLFEANRLFYSYGDIDTAYKRMLQYVGTRPDSKLTPPTCALIMDTLIESEAWVATRTLSMKFLTMPNVAVGDFKTKLQVLEQDSHYKIIQNFYKTKDYPKVVQFGEEHLKLYPQTKRKVDIIAMLGKASIETQNQEASLAYMNQVIELSPNHDSAGAAYFIRAQDHEKAFRFKQAFDDYYKIYKLPSDKRGIGDKDIGNLKKKLFVLGLTSDDQGVLKLISQAPEFCGIDKPDPDLRVECDRFVATQLLKREDRRTPWQLVEAGDKSAASARSAWYAAALMKGSPLPNSVLKRVIEDLQKSMDKLDPMTQMEVLSSLNVSIPAVFQKKIETVESLSKIDKRIDYLKNSLEKRVREVTGLENLAAAMILLPSPEVRVNVLGRLSQAFLKVAEEIRAIPVPKGFQAEEAEVFKQAMTQLIVPLTQKYEQIGQQSWEISKKFGLKTFWVDSVTLDQTGHEFENLTLQWNERQALLDSLPEDYKKTPWAQAVKTNQVRPMIFFYQFSQTPESERLKMSENEKTVLQMATLAGLNMPSSLVQQAKDKESAIRGEALRMSLLVRILHALEAQSYADIKNLRAIFDQKGFDDENKEEAKILKLAETFEKRTNEYLAKKDAEAKAQAKAELEAKSRAPAQKTEKNEGAKK
jgi:hypothetical protein